MRVLNTILLVDDDATTNYLNQRLLNQLQIARHIKVATNGEEALDYLSRHCLSPSPETDYFCPELILLDIKMPVMDGFEFLDEYQKLKARLAIPAVITMLTSSASLVDLNRLRQYDCIRKFLNKPLQRDHINQLIEEFFQP